MILAVAVDISQAELECNLKLYDRPLDDYLEIVIQASLYCTTLQVNITLMSSLRDHFCQ